MFNFQCSTKKRGRSDTPRPRLGLAKHLINKRLFHISKEIFHFVFVNDHLLVGVFTRYRIFNGFHHFDVVFTGTCIGGTLRNTGVFGNFLCHNSSIKE